MNINVFRMWFVLVVLLSAVLAWHVPFQIHLLISLAFFILLISEFLNKSKKIESGQGNFFVNLVKLGILGNGTASAYAFKALTETSVIAGFSYIPYLLLVQFLLFSIMALAIYFKRDRLIPESIFTRGFKYSLLVFAFVVSALVLLVPVITGVNVAEQMQSQFETVGFVTDYGTRILPKWFTGSNMQATLGLTALGAWLIFFAGIIVLYSDNEQIRQSKHKFPVAISVVLLVLVSCLAPSFVLVRYFSFNLKGSCYAEEWSKKAYFQGMYETLDDLRRLDMTGVEAKLLNTARECLVAHEDTAVIGDYDILADISARMILLEPTEPKHQLALASSLFRINEVDGLKLFDPAKIKDEKLDQYKAETLADAQFLSTVYAYRNKTREAREVLKPFVKKINLDKQLQTIKRRAVVEYSEYCLYMGEYDEALDLMVRFDKHNDGDYRTFITLGELYYEKDNISKAFMNFKKAFQRNKQSRRTIWNLVALYYQTGHPDSVVPYAGRLDKKFLGSDLIGPQHGRFFVNGESFLQTYLIPGRTRVGIVARGTRAKEEWPTLEFWVNGQKWGMAKVDSETNKGFAFEFDANRGINRLTFKFTNDYGDKNEDRNLRIVSGFIRPIFYEGQKR